ncbi:MAG TPA: HAD family hydrolase [Candidatus Krumholzibacteriaceae bacterium]|nr:HAD family hydrolase [Candidatus Krumholzibacteriaceae bacterium]
MAFKAVILDFGGTIADGGLEWEPYHEAIRIILTGKGYDVEMGELKRALKGALQELNKLRARGKERTFEEVYAMFLRRLGIPEDAELLGLLHDNFKMYYRTEYLHCVEDVLKELSSRYKVALLSNTMSDQPRELLQDSGLDRYFDLIVCSRDTGVRKPNPEIFRLVLSELEVEPGEAVHVGDSVEADMYGAQDSGLTGVWIRSPNQPPWNGYAVDSICELPRLLREIEAGETS